jgi:hypothetical protein
MKEEIASIVNQLSYVESLLTEFVKYETDEIWNDRLLKVKEYKLKIVSYSDLNSNDELVDVLLSTNALLKIIYADSIRLIKMQQPVIMQ